MAVPEQIPYVGYIANGVTNEFAITFDLHDPQFLIVTLNKEIPILGAYTVDTVNKKVIFGLAPSTGDQVEFYRDTKLDRVTEYKSYDNSFRPEALNWDLDKIWMTLQEQNLIDSKILARLKSEIEWRRTHDFNYDELAQIREKQLFDALKGYTDTLNAATNPGVFQGVIAGVVFAQDGKSIQSHLDEILENLEQERALIETKASSDYVDQQFNARDIEIQSKAPKTTTDNLQQTKADKEYVDIALASFTNGSFKAYPTLAAANADIANIPLNTKVNVLSAIDGGDYYKETAISTELKKSPFDPIALGEKKFVAGELGKNLFNKAKIATGKGLGDAGGEITAAGRNASEFISISPNIAYSFSATTKACFYDASKVFLQLSTGAIANVVSHASAAFVRIDITDANLNTAQIEQNIIKTPYEVFGPQLKENVIKEKNLIKNSVSEDKLQSASIAARHFKDAVFLNMHNPTLLRIGFSISFSDGVTETVTGAYDITEYIPCLPNTQYSCATHSRVFFYRKDGSHISNAAFVTPFNTPADCYQMRFQISNLISNRFQLNIGAVLPTTQQAYKFELPQLHIKPQTKAELNAITARRYSFSDAWVAWLNGEKFPICFLGDSTTNGNGTTGYVARPQPYDFTQDYIAPNSYCAVLQNLIQEATGNSTARIYNAGFSGQNTGWALTNIDAIMGSTYSDTKMMGISGGINDRTSNPKLLADLYGPRLEGAIKWCFDKGIQPFLLTTQPLTIPRQLDTASMSRTEEIVNEIKRNMAAKYNLEIIDVNKFGQLFMQYSSKPLLNNIMEPGSTIHFGNGGHKFTAELLFSRFCKRPIWVDGPERLDFSTQLVKSDIYNTELQQLAVFKNDFKLELNLTQADTTNRLLQEFYVFNAGKRALNLSAYYANAVEGQYVEVDGVQTTITQQGQNLGALDLGLHKIKAYSSATTTLDWLGFKLI